MNLEFSPEQEALRKAVRDFIRGHLPVPRAKEILRFEENPTGFSRAIWGEMAALGWMGCAIPHEYDGVGGSFLDLTIILEEIGRSCLPGPFFSTVLTASVILEAGTGDQKKEFLPPICDGRLVATLALTEPNAQWDSESVQTTARLHQGNYILSGTKLFVADADIADILLVATRTGENSNGKDCITLFLINTMSPGMAIEKLDTIASDRKCKVVLDDMKVSKDAVLGGVDMGWPFVKRALERATAAKCAEMVGGARQVLDMTVQYARDRVQFGKPIGSFQAVQQHCANMAIDLDASRFLTCEAAWALSEGIPCSMEISVAKAWVSDAYQRITRLGQQIHGAIGYTKEHDLQLYFRRAEAAAIDWGGIDFHRKVVAHNMGL